jgi:hypothetical protein
MQHKYVRLSDGIEIAVPVGMTPEQEADYIAKRWAEQRSDPYLRGVVDAFKAQSPEVTAAEDRELLKAMEKGDLFTLEEILTELEAGQQPPGSQEVA